MDRELSLLLSALSRHSMARLVNENAWQTEVKFREDDGLERKEVDFKGGKSVFNALCLDCPQKFRDKDKYLTVIIDKKYAAPQTWDCLEAWNLELPRGMAPQGFSTEMHHGDVLLMSRTIQREFTHCTVPATEWSTTWATADAYTMEAAQKCQWKPTQDQPRINITARYITNHQCDMNPRIPSLLPLPPPPEQAPADAHPELTSAVGPVGHN